MTAEQVLSHCQEYLDKQLDPSMAREIESFLLAHPDVAREFENQRRFHALMKKCAANIEYPPALNAGIQRRLAQARAAQSPFIVRMFRNKGILALAASVLLMVGGAWFYYVTYFECPYMVACTEEHQKVIQGSAKLDKDSSDPIELAKYSSTAMGMEVPLIPVVEDWKPVGAGKTNFASLKKYGAPDGVLLKYQNDKKELLSVLVHPWKEETPMNMNLTQYHGHSYWLTRHNGQSVAVWKTDDGTILWSVISSRPKEEVIALAAEMREKLSAKAKVANGGLLKASIQFTMNAL